MTRGRFWQNIFLMPCIVFDLCRHLCDVILFYFTNFTTSSPFWTTQLDFYEIFTTSEIVQHDQRKILAKYFFDVMSRSWLMALFIDVILLYFTNLTTSSLFWATSLDFHEIFMWNKFVLHDQRSNLAQYYFDIMSRFGPMTSFITFCSYVTNFTNSLPF